MFNGNDWWTCEKKLQGDVSKMAGLWHKICKKNRHFPRRFETLSRFSKFYFLTDIDASKSVD